MSDSERAGHGLSEEQRNAAFAPAKLCNTFGDAVDTLWHHESFLHDPRNDFRGLRRM